MMFRLSRGRAWAAWTAASLCWIGYWCWHDVTTCRSLHLRGGWAIACRWQVMQPGGPMLMERTAPGWPVLGHMVAQAIVLPLGVLILGFMVNAAIEAMRTRRG